MRKGRRRAQRHDIAARARAATSAAAPLFDAVRDCVEQCKAFAAQQPFHRPVRGALAGARKRPGQARRS
jgi:hypothetical protein